MRIMTWNIWKGKFLEKVIGQISNENPDVVCLQEIVEQEVDEQKLNMAELIARKLGYEFIFCKSFTTDWIPPANLGNAILSKLPITSASCHQLSTLDTYRGNSVTEPRSAVKIEISLGGKTLTLITCHLGYGVNFQETETQSNQLDELLKIIPQEKTVLAGDFNSLPNSKVFRILDNLMVNTDPDCTEYSYTDMKDERHPEHRIDYIYTTADVRFDGFQILSTDASDHSPLIVNIAI